MTCNCPKCCYTEPTPVNDTPPMFYLKQKYDNQNFAITEPADLSVKSGGVVVTTGLYEPNYLSIPGDKWVSSKGTIMTCEQLFKELSTYTNTKLVYLSDYDFQGM